MTANTVSGDGEMHVSWRERGREGSRESLSESMKKKRRRGKERLWEGNREE